MAHALRVRFVLSSHVKFQTETRPRACPGRMFSLGKRRCPDQRPGSEENNAMADDQMIQERRRTWSGFVKLLAFSSAAAVICLALLAIFTL